MKHSQVRVLAVAFLLAGNVAGGYAQNAAASPGSGSGPVRLPNAPLSRQYREVVERSNTYQGYKIVKQELLQAFWNSVQDSIAKSRQELAFAQKRVNTQKAELDQVISSQKGELTSLKQTLQTKDNAIQQKAYNDARVTVLGVPILKQHYVTGSWLVFGGLLALAGAAFYGYNRSNKVAVTARKDYDEVKSELEDYRKKLLENKTQLGRELQTERNKIEELNQEIAYLQKQMHLQNRSGSSSFPGSSGFYNS